ncbi:ABC-type transporter, integral membrane subunit [Pseudonocardia dioxanivorans CB1190]|jgi:peptide/nickel transport system permease protein|uniref:ABC-type transporter, integral membrane subunit n=1 Tax=Pseudonocardia dioxanivorans (strain ATCC 55486 / DSM 44775 / JCM 13855 / CB1190) TaxID=675635 RepID=F4D109_PSEUX|nr:ABC transporter permease [Pseudonocardia dioxanivorans]AEA26797.1 ABC-type transporter, integral membrane subunit [Pseudonocardia dioxanivorans CB1190]GJF01045.1 glutathione ABC transporter permease [Pseudonocardia sp. D17]
MLGYVGRRLLMAIPILFGVSIVIFITIKIIPGDPVASLLGPTGSPEARAALTERLGLNEPWPVQYVTWLGHTLTGDLGTSIARRSDVAPMVLDALMNTLILSAAAAVIAIVLGVAVGALTALRRTGILARLGNALALFSISVPQYSIGLLLIIYLAAGAGLFPVSGMYNPNGDGGFVDLFNHLILPAVTAALVPAGIIARMFRSSVLDVMSMDFVEALTSRGLSHRRVMVHAFHNTVPSLLTVAGLQIGYLLGGVIFVEAVFAWPGIGLLVYQSITQRDLPVIQAGVLVSALAFVVLNLVVDALHGLVDPRIRA